MNDETTITATGHVRIVPGVEGPRRITSDIPISHPVADGGHVMLRLDVRWDDDVRRYVCHELRVTRSTTPVTTTALRSVKIDDQIRLMLSAGVDVDGNVVEPAPIRDLDNPRGREPWGQRPPAGVRADIRAEGPTSRALAWTAHLYRLGWAIDGTTTLTVERLGVSRATARRWIQLARDEKLLGPSEGRGRAGV